MRKQHDNPLDYESANQRPSSAPSGLRDLCALCTLAAATVLLLVYLPMVLVFVGEPLGDGPGEGFDVYLIAICIAAPLGFVLGLIGMAHGGFTRVVAAIAATLHGLMLLLILYIVILHT